MRLQVSQIRDALRLELSWTHYRLLMRLGHPSARNFYELECARNHWSTRELERQIASSLYERLALSKDKKAVRRLAKKGQEVQKYEDMVKNPYVLEFTGLSPQARLYESSLEQALCDNLSKFLLELGKGFAAGLILCSDKKEAVVRYTLPKGKRQIFASRYKLYLPTEEELRAELKGIER